MLKDLIDLFWTRYARLKRAVAAGDEQMLGGIDRDVESLLEAIFEHKATNAIEVQMQVGLAIELLKVEAEDRSCVLRHADNLQRIVERHLRPRPISDLYHHVVDAAPVTVTSRSRAERGLLDITMLDRLPNRVCVISTDYRYLYCNENDARSWDRRPEELNGVHIGEVIGLHRFSQGFKERLDNTFLGETVDYTFAEAVGDRTRVLRCRLSPYRSPSSRVIGALVLMEEIADRRQPGNRAA